MRRMVNPNVLAVTFIIAAIILYGSLYPFDFRRPDDGLGPVRTLLQTWANRPRRGDFLANLLLYAPFGLFGALAMGSNLRLTARVLPIVVAGAVLSIGIELAQYFDAHRVVSAQDVYANLLGTAAGAFAGLLTGPNLRFPLARQMAAKPFASLILAAWLGYRLYPFVPVIDLHKYWNAIKPVFLTPSLPVYDLFRYTVAWLCVCALVESIAGHKRSLRQFPVFAVGVFFAKILIVSHALFLPDILGATVGFALWGMLIERPERLRAAVIAVPLLIYVLIWRLQPFQFADRGASFGWIPFLSLMRGSLTINVESFLEKIFYYGVLIWLITAAGARPRIAAISVALLLFGISLAEIYLPGRSAEITDAFMVLIVAAVAALMRRAQPQRSEP